MTKFAQYGPSRTALSVAFRRSRGPRTALVYCGYIGGTGSDRANGIAVDSTGCAYITGETTSSGATFPVVGGPGTTYGGGRDGFVAKVKADGSALVYCGYIGGSRDDYGSGIAVDSAGCAYVTGDTGSSETTFPVEAGPDLTYGGGADAFVAKVNPAGTALMYCGYISGSGYDRGFGIAVDSSGCAYVTGQTASRETTFPVKAGPDLTYNGGKQDAFVAKVKADGTALVFCGYIGGWYYFDDENQYETGRGIAVDSSGCAYVTGQTPSSTFPVRWGPDVTLGDLHDAFVAKLQADGTAFVYCGYIGGEGDDSGNGIAVDSSGCAYVAGVTKYSQTDFPVEVGPDITSNGYEDAFVAKVTTIAGLPAVDSLSPTSGPTAGGTTVTITGTNLRGATAVMFGSPGGQSNTPSTANDYNYTTRYEQADSRLVYGGTWSAYTTTSASGGSYTRTKTSGSSVVIPFYGSCLNWIATKATSMGKASVSVDGKTAVVVNLNAATTTYKQNVWSTGALTTGYHTVKISWYSGNAAGKYVSLDAIDVAGSLTGTTRYQETDHLVFNPSWWSASHSGASGGKYVYTNTAGAQVTFSFTGVSVSILGRKASNYGRAYVSIDGHSPVLVDFYASSPTFTTVWSSGFIKGGTHTVVIQRAGSKNSRSSGYTVSLDALSIRGVLK